MHTFGRRRVARTHIAYQRHHPYSSRRRGLYMDEDNFTDQVDDDIHNDKYDAFEEDEADDDGNVDTMRQWHCTRQISREVSDRIVIAVLSNQDLLLSSTLAKTAQNNRRKARKWLEIVEGLACLYPDQPLSIKTVKKNFDYSKRRVRAARRRYEFALSQSGDGPQPADPTQSFSVAERMLDMYLRSSSIPAVTSVVPQTLKVEETTPPIDDDTPDGPSTSRADDIPLQAASILDQHLVTEEPDDATRKRRLYDKLEAFLDAAIPLLHGISQHFGFSSSQSSPQHTHLSCVPNTNAADGWAHHHRHHTMEGDGL